MRGKARATSQGSSSFIPGSLGRLCRKYDFLVGLLVAVPFAVLGGTAAQAATGPCANEAFRVGSSANLPECRAYEQVSPASKSGADAGQAASLFNARSQAGEDGKSIAYPASLAYDGATSSFTVGNWYMASRGKEGRWSNESLMPPMAPFTQFLGAYGPYRVSPDMSTAVTYANVDENGGPLLDGSGQQTNDVTMLYDRIGAKDDRYDLLRQGEWTGGTGLPGDTQTVGGDDWNPLYFTAREQLTLDAPIGTEQKVYKYEDGVITLASLLPTGTPTDGVLEIGGEGGLRRVSADGGVLYFTANPEPSGAGGGEIYRRDDSGAVRVDQAEGGPDASDNRAEFLTTAVDGSRSLFRTPQALVPEDAQPNQDLYVYDHSADPENDRNLQIISVDAEPADGSMANVQGLLGANEEATVAYFATAGQIVEGAPTEPARKLYRWEDGPDGGTIAYLGGVGSGPADAQAWLNSPTAAAERPAQVSPDGRYLMVRTDTSLTTDPTGGFTQIYLYDSTTEQWACVSCPPDGSSSTAAATLRRDIGGGINTVLVTQATRNLSSEGHVFFETSQPLVSRDTNGDIDVYAWKDGGVNLISSGRSSEPAYFADASADGSDVFIYTKEPLVPSDTDANADLYDAKIGGGSAAPDPVVQCEGDACQGGVGKAPDAEDPGSQQYEGKGNGSEVQRPVGRSCKSFQRKARMLKQRAKKAASSKRVQRLRRKSRAQRRKYQKCKTQDRAAVSSNGGSK